MAERAITGYGGESTFNEDFQRALDSKLNLQRAEAAKLDEQARYHGLDVDSAAYSRYQQGDYYGTQANVAAMESYLEDPFLADQLGARGREALNPGAFYGSRTGAGRFFGREFFGRDYADGGLVGGASADYELYRQAADAAGLPALPAEEAIPVMAQLRAKNRQALLQTIQRGGTVPGYAAGGAVDISGTVINGPGTGKSDSIPAVVDGVAPAAVSDGEMVIPKHVVDYYGTKMLDSLIEKARVAMKAKQMKGGA